MHGEVRYEHMLPHSAYDLNLVPSLPSSSTSPCLLFIQLYTGRTLSTTQVPLSSVYAHSLDSQLNVARVNRIRTLPIGYEWRVHDPISLCLSKRGSCTFIDGCPGRSCEPAVSQHRAHPRPAVLYPSRVLYPAPHQRIKATHTASFFI